MKQSTYPAAGLVAPKVHEYLSRCRLAVDCEIAPLPTEAIIESIIDIAFWTSLRREELYPPRISIAYLPPELATPSLKFESPLPFSPNSLTKIAPGVERPGIHLGVWQANGELRVWGATRSIPRLSFVVETVAPGQIVIKCRQSEGAAKFKNVAVLEGDQVKMLDQTVWPALVHTPTLSALLGVESQSITASDSSNILVRIAISMRDHKRGGTVLLVPRTDDSWRHSISHPISYSVSPAYTELAELCRENPSEDGQRRWREALLRAVDAVAGLTAIDGATIISDEYEVLAFGAKIIRSPGADPLEVLAAIEPIEDARKQIIPVAALGGTRHISAAQFVFEQRNSLALVASQDGPFTIFAWSAEQDALFAHRVDSLLL